MRHVTNEACSSSDSAIAHTIYPKGGGNAALVLMLKTDPILSG
jgi:hypothetical protein